MTKARIFRPAQSTTQSGKGCSQRWHLRFDSQKFDMRDPVTGWFRSSNTLKQVDLTFASVEDAKAYATAHHIDYTVIHPHVRTPKVRRYGDHFRYRPAMIDQ